MLAYIFWHRPRPGVDGAAYLDDLNRFHIALAEHPSPGFRRSWVRAIHSAPWLGSAGYADSATHEDWYLVDDWGALGELNAAAVSEHRLAPHDAVAAQSARGAGAIYALIDGEPGATAHAAWFAKPANGALDVDVPPGGSLWQRQLVLGPAPEFCLLTQAPASVAQPSLPLSARP